MAFVKDISRKPLVSGYGAAGSALDWGSRGRGFKSRYSDQEKVPQLRNAWLRDLLCLTINRFLFPVK